MAVDEAILRVILQGQGGAGGTPGLPGGGGGTGGSTGITSTPDFFKALNPILGNLGNSIAGIAKHFGVGEGLAAAAGPAALGIGILLATKKLADEFNGAIDSVGKFSAGLLSASTDPSQGLMHFGSSVKSAADKIFWLSPNLSILGSTVGTLTNTLGELMKAMDGMVDRYAMYSPGIAYASAQSQITQIMNEFRRAQEVTPSLVQYLQARTDLQQKYEDAKARFLTQATPVILFGMRFMEAGMDAINKWLGVNADQDTQEAFQSITDIIMKNRGEFGKMFQRDIPPFAR